MLKFSELQTSRSFDVCPLLFCSSMEWWTVGSLLLAKDNYLVWTNVAANDDRLKNFPAIVWDWSHPSLNGYMDNFPACFQSSIHSVCLSNHQIGKVRMDPVLLTWTTPGWLDINIEYFKSIKNNSQTCPQMYLDQLILDWQIACYWEISKPSAFSGHPWQGGVKELAHAQKHEKHHLSWGVSLKKTKLSTLASFGFVLINVWLRVNQSLFMLFWYSLGTSRTQWRCNQRKYQPAAPHITKVNELDELVGTRKPPWY